MARTMDGIRPPAATKFNQEISSERVRPRRRWFLLGSLTLLLFSFVAFLQPILAAVPLDSWDERLALGRLMQPGRYLVLFQNSRELRPTGGFIGSYATVEMGWGGQIKDVTVETNIFTTDNLSAPQLNIDTPEPLRVLIGNRPWSLHDSNWAIDFPEAAKTMAWFYEAQGNAPVDGVLALDSRILERILVLTGPIALPGYDLVLTAENVIDAIQEQVELRYWEREENIAQNKPKTILADLLPIMLAKLRDQPPASGIDLIHAAFEAREIQASFSDVELRDIMRKYQWDGHIREGEADDFLTLNEANLTPANGKLTTKSSHIIERKLTLTRDDSGLHRLRIDRQLAWATHFNDSYLRVAVPFGSILENAERNGKSITAEVRESSESGMTVFGFWSRLDPEAHDIVTLTYRTPKTGPASLLYQMQAGMPAIHLEIWDGEELRMSGQTATDRVLAPAL